MHVVLRWFINAVALLAAAFVVPGIHLSSSGRPGFNEWVTLAIVAAIFGVINAIIRPVVVLQQCMPNSPISKPRSFLTS